MNAPFNGFIAVTVLFLLCALDCPAEKFRVAAYNLENYLDRPTQTRTTVKSPEARSKIRDSILAARPDVIAFEEMGEPSALSELQSSLKSAGLNFPYSEHITGFDTNIHVAVLSKLPFTARHPHTNDNFLLNGRRFRVLRGFIELDIAVGTNFSFTLFSAHLKSRVPGPAADQSELRLEEAKILREHIDAKLKAAPEANIIAVGDFNDSPNSKPLKNLVGRGKFALIDTRPTEKNQDGSGNFPDPRIKPRTVAWTHFYATEDSYSRIDYILISPAMAKYWMRAETFIPQIPDWGIGSDHRLIVATFDTALQTQH